jgi:ABC-2 type transport system permease protein
MSRLLAVVRREYLERVRSRSFLVATLLAPLLLSGFLLVPRAVMTRQRGAPLRIAVLDASGRLRGPVEEALARQKLEGESRFRIEPAGEGAVKALVPRLRTAVLGGELDGYLYLPEDALARSQAEYYGRNVSNVMDLRMLDRAVEKALIGLRLSAEGLDGSRVAQVTRHLDLKLIRLSEAGAREDRGTTVLFSVVLMMMLYTTILLWGQAVMAGVIEEKSNRVVEVMVSSISSLQLFAGKLLGVGAAGLTQFLVWSLFLAGLAGLGMGTPALLGEAALPEVTPLVLFSFVAFFLLGYFLYAALFAAVGAAVNTAQEAQGLVFPIFMPLLAGMACFPAVLHRPDSPLSTVLSLVPLVSPLLMFLRITVLTPPAWQIALSFLLTLLAIAGVTWVAARVYRVGILMYGKRPSLPEIARWVRQS